MSQDISNEPLHKYVSEYVWHALGESWPFGQKYWSHFSLCAYMYTHWPPRPPGPAETHWSPGPFGPPGYPDQPDLPNQTTLTHSSCLESSYRKSVQLALFEIADTRRSRSWYITLSSCAFEPLLVVSGRAHCALNWDLNLWLVNTS